MAVGTAAAIIGGAAAIGGAIGEASAAGDEAEAAAKMAQARQQRADEIARRQQETALRERAEARAAAEPTAQELATVQQQLDVGARAIQRQEQLLDAVDPALKEAGKQALALLQGQEAATLGPLNRQRQRQRAMLENRLREQLGSGYETSSAGIEALTRFDEETANVSAQAQQSAVSSLLGVAQNVRPRPEGLAAALSPGLQGLQTIAGRRTQAASISTAAYSGLGSPEFAGSEHAGALAEAQGKRAMYGSISSLGGQAAGAGLGLMASEDKKKGQDPYAIPDSEYDI